LTSGSLPSDDAILAALLMVNLAFDANVQFMTIIATETPFIGRG
jgi:hypothetical protein